MLEAQQLHRRFGSLEAVSGVSFCIQPGEVVGLLGHNGAGKSTIMKMLTGALEPNAGSVKFDGRDMREHRKALQMGIGYLPENCPVYPDMTVVDYLDFRAVLHGVAEAWRPRAIRRAIERTALQEKALDRIGTLSRGYRQRVGVAQAILHEPELIILDEPTNGLDPAQIHQMRDLIRSLAGRAAVLISTHILQEVQAVCERVLVVRHGELALDASLADLGGADRLLITTDADDGQLRDALSGLAGVAGIHPASAVGDRHGYEITLDDGADADALAPALARRTLEAGCALYRLEPRARDLETVYAEINRAA